MKDIQDDRPPTDPEEAREFTSVISGLQNTYPQDKLSEISTSFCFICLLHLANERGLKLEVGEEDEGVAPQNVVESRIEDEEARVGNLWGLKVCSLKSFVLHRLTPERRCSEIQMLSQRPDLHYTTDNAMFPFSLQSAY